MLFEIISHEAIINGHNMSMEENIISSQYCFSVIEKEILKDLALNDLSERLQMKV